MSISLHCKNDRSDKVYHMQIEKQNGGYVVNFQFGRRGSTLQRGTKTPRPVDLQTASEIFEKIVFEKMNGPSAYKEMGNGTSAPINYQSGSYKRQAATFTAQHGNIATQAVGRTEYPAELLEMLSEEEAMVFLEDDNYFMQVKYNGKRVQIRKVAGKVTAYNKLGTEIPVHPDVEKAILALPIHTIFLDGELVNGQYIAFDIFRNKHVTVANRSYESRYETLMGALVGRPPLGIAPVYKTTTTKKNMLEKLRKVRAEGAVFKLKSAPYKAGRNGQHKKFKFWKSLSAIVLALRPTGKDSISLGLVENGTVINVGNVTTIGKKYPGVGGVVEVKYLYATKDKQLYQPEVIGPRDDVTQRECTTKQLVYQEGI